jgi:hypothetical protein
VKNLLGKINIRSVKMEYPVGKNEKLTQLKWKIRSVNTKNSLGNNGTTAQYK